MLSGYLARTDWRKERSEQKIVSAEWKAVREGNELDSYPGIVTYILPLESETATSASLVVRACLDESRTILTKFSLF